MKIDSIYVLCSKQDVYFANICIASIRYWNTTTPVYLIKDLSKGNFDTYHLEQTMQVKLVDTCIKNLGYFSKLYPFIEKKEERALVLDADIIWMCDMISVLEPYHEDLVIDGYSPENMEEEKGRWYFFDPSFSKNYPDYVYPGFFFNAGQLLFNTQTFSKSEFLELVNWQEYPSTKVENAFLNDQGILNYLVAEKIKQQQLNYRNVNFHVWGWSKVIHSLTVNDILLKKPFSYLIHWYGKKNGLISFLPGSTLLKFYEKYYYSHLPKGNYKLMITRLKRTLLHFDKFIYELLKKVYYSFFKNAKRI
jgi:hypothetical protein